MQLFPCEKNVGGEIVIEIKYWLNGNEIEKEKKIYTFYHKIKGAAICKKILIHH